MRRYRTINISKRKKDYAVTIDGITRFWKKQDLKRFFREEIYLCVTARNFSGEILFIEEIKK